jgi:hypothetical protein
MLTRSFFFLPSKTSQSNPSEHDSEAPEPADIVRLFMSRDASKSTLDIYGIAAELALIASGSNIQGGPSTIAPSTVQDHISNVDCLRIRKRSSPKRKRDEDENVDMPPPACIYKLMGWSAKDARSVIREARQLALAKKEGMRLTQNVAYQQNEQLRLLAATTILHSHIDSIVKISEAKLNELLDMERDMEQNSTAPSSTVRRSARIRQKNVVQESKRRKK